MGRKGSLTKTILILLLTAGVLYLLFMPKYGGYEHYDTFYGPGAVLREEHCTCFGVKDVDVSNQTNEARMFVCYGIPTDCRSECFTKLGRIKVEAACLG